MVWYVPPFIAKNSSAGAAHNYVKRRAKLRTIGHKNAGRLSSSLPAIIS